MRRIMDRRNSVVAFRVTPTIAAQLRKLAEEEQRTLSTWMNMRAQEVIKAYEERDEEKVVQEHLL